MEKAADGAQHGVAGRVAQRVIEPLEVVQVEHERGERPLFAVGAAQFAFQRFLHVTPVIEARQRIADGLDVQRLAQAQAGQRQAQVIGHGQRQAVLRVGHHRPAIGSRRSHFQMEHADGLALRHHGHA